MAAYAESAIDLRVKLDPLEGGANSQRYKADQEQGVVVFSQDLNIKIVTNYSEDTAKQADDPNDFVGCRRCCHSCRF